MMQRILAVLSALVLFSGLAFGQTAQDDPEAAAAFIDQLSNDAIAVWTDPALTEPERRARFDDLLSNGFAIDYIAQLALGRHARTASKDELDQYMAVFPKYIIDVFSDRIGEYGDERFEVTGTAPAGQRDIYVRSNIIRPSSDNLLADWRVRRIGDKLQIIDIKLEGISMVRTQRDDFQEKISSSGMEGLIQELYSRLGTSAETASTDL
ncbi:MAG: phospholipid-binding protein MlaC [Rhodothalassiaceae bacterium]